MEHLDPGSELVCPHVEGTWYQRREGGKEGRTGKETVDMLAQT